ncbi:hypothetical protein EDD21DRAFT_58397 [Dissophora ornata]|nr:hypothetical protein EDD21DRAFT_58397 [Dissophora ornata]
MGRTQGISGLHGSGTGTGLSSLPHPTHRSSLKTPNQVRWPVSLSQLAVLSLDDDSDLDRSFTEGSRDDIGSVRLLRMLKDSDDDDSMSPVPPQSKLQRPRSTYSTLPQQRPQQQQLKGGIPMARSSSLHGVSGSHSAYNTNLPRPQHTRSDNKGTGASASPNGVARPTGHRSQSGMSLVAAKRQPQGVQSPDDMEHIFSEANAVAQRLGGSPSTAVDSNNAGRDKAQGIRTPNIRSGSLPSPVARSATGKLPSPSSSGHGSPSTGRLQPKSRLSAPPKLPGASPVSNLVQRASVPGSRQDPRQANILRDQREPDRVTLSPPRVPGSPSSAQPPRKLAGLQYSPLSRPMMPRQAGTDTYIATATPPTQPVSMLPPSTTAESNSNMIILELTEELERWKTEASEFRQERLAAESWRKQVSTLERDLEVALDALQSAEGQVIEVKAAQQTAGSKLTEFEIIIESLKADLDIEKAEKDKALAIASEGQKEELQELQSRNEELEQKLTQAQKEIDQLELQVVPVELQDVHQSLFSATQELEDAKRHNEKLKQDLAGEKDKVAREQEDSGQLLLKLSQLQVTISNHIRDNSALKEVVKEHEKCQENTDALDYQHKKELERLQNEIMGVHQMLVQEKDQRSRLHFRSINTRCTSCSSRLSFNRHSFCSSRRKLSTLARHWRWNRNRLLCCNSDSKRSSDSTTPSLADGCLWMVT